MAEGNFEIVKIADNSWRIEDGMVRAFLFEGTERALLVDSGFGEGNIREVVEGLTGKPVMLVNTHGDDDHTGCNSLFDKAYMHPAEFAFYYEAVPSDAVVSPLWEGDIIDIGGRKFEVILIPGHTPGSIALLDRENRILISGDTISETPIFMFGKVRSVPALIVSLEKLSKLSDSFDTVYPSHGPFPVSKDLIAKEIAVARKLINGELEGQDPPFEIPARMYIADGAAFFYDLKK
ncbi:MAG: MBL fold metallo-hydrolase [Spirochaetes bacterium]|nr:MBL fold metallo-hydrolase [Spirochaetota bacterium]